MLESNDKDLIQTSAFTFSNLCRGSNPPLDKIYECGIITPLFQHLKVIITYNILIIFINS